MCVLDWYYDSSHCSWCLIGKVQTSFYIFRSKTGFNCFKGVTLTVQVKEDSSLDRIRTDQDDGNSDQIDDNELQITE